MMITLAYTGMDVRAIERSSVTEVICPKQYTILAVPKIHHTLSPLIAPDLTIIQQSIFERGMYS